MKGRFGVIGLGNFGSQVARTLFGLGHDIICLDEREGRMRLVQEYATFSLVGSAHDPDTLAALHVKELDAVFVSLGHEISDSILAVLHLRDQGAKRIIAKIISEDHGRILLKLGASEVIFPERDMAVRVANYVSSPTIVNYLDLDPEYSILEVMPLPEFIGKTLAQTLIRQDYGVNVIGIRNILMDKITINPQADYEIKESDSLIVIGHRDDLTLLNRKTKKKK